MEQGNIGGAEIGGYRVVRPLASGGMSEIWLGEHTLLGRRVAIKRLRPALSRHPDIFRRLFNEARAMTAIGDPGIVQIFDYGVHADGSAYIVMELLEGETLGARLERRGTLSIPEALHIVRQVATSLAAAHACGIIHRDLKPDNIFLVRDPEVVGGERAKILDFGIAQLRDDPMRTHESLVLGTPAFMSPEQCHSAASVEHRSDVYSLGCVLYTLVTGQLPFASAGGRELMTLHVCDAPPMPSHRTDGVPPAIDRLVLRCLSKDPMRRYSAAQLATAIGELFRAPAASGLHGRAVVPFAGAGAPVRRRRRTIDPSLALAAVTAMALLVSGLAWLAVVTLSLTAFLGP